MDDSIPFDKIGTEKAKQEHENRRTMSRKDEREIMEKHGVKGAEANRILHGGADYSLFNLILTTADHSKIIKQGSVRKAFHYIYDCLWPYIKTLVEDNRRLKAELMLHLKPAGSILLEYEGKVEEEIEIGKSKLSPGMKEVVERKDPLTYSKEVLDAVRAEARRRSRNKVYNLPSKSKIII